MRVGKFWHVTLLLTLTVGSVACFGENPDERDADQGVAASGEAEGLRLEVRIDQREFTAGESVDATLVVTNVSDGVRHFWEAPPPIGLDIEMLGRDQAEMPLTRFGRWMKQADQLLKSTSRNVLIRLGPGEGMRYVIRANRVYDLTVEGEYTMRAKLSVPRVGPAGAQGKRSSLQTEPLTIRIVSPQLDAVRVGPGSKGEKGRE